MENQINSNDANDTSATAEVVTIKKRCPKKGLWIVILAVLVFLVIYSIGMYRLIAINKQLASVTTTLNNQLLQSQKDIADLQKTQADAQQNLQLWHTDLVRQGEALTELNNAEQTKNDDWTVAEAQYLVKLANDNLQIGDNIPLVINLLQTADKELQNSTNPKLDAIRKALAEDLMNVKAIPQIDVTGIYLRLSALNDQVNQLPLPTKRPDSAAISASSEQTTWWRRGLQNTWLALQKIVVVRYNQPGVRPFILPEQQEFLYQNIHAMYGQAMSALVHRQPEIYRASLRQAQQWIQKYFLADSSVTTAQLKELDELQKIDIRPSLPAVTASLQAFHDYSMQRLTR